MAGRACASTLVVLECLVGRRTCSRRRSISAAGSLAVGRWSSGLSSWQMTVIVLGSRRQRSARCSGDPRGQCATVVDRVRGGAGVARPGPVEWVTVVGAGLASGIAGACVIMATEACRGPLRTISTNFGSGTGRMPGSRPAPRSRQRSCCKSSLPRRGAAAGLVAGVLAALTSSIGFLIFNTVARWRCDATFVRRLRPGRDRARLLRDVGRLVRVAVGARARSRQL